MSQSIRFSFYPFKPQFYTDVATYQLWQNSTGHRVYHCKTYYRIEIQIMYELVKR